MDNLIAKNTQPISLRQHVARTLTLDSSEELLPKLKGLLITTR